MTLRTVSGVLAADVANAGTFTLNYPAGTSRSDFLSGVFNEFILNQVKLTWPDKFILTLGATTITVTNKSGATWLAGSPYVAGLDMPGKSDLFSSTSKLIRGTRRADSLLINLGNPAAGAANSIFTSAAILTASGNVVPTGTLLVGSAAVCDVPRNVVAAWTGTAVMTITGTDEYGNVVKESSASGTSLTGKKAFKTVTGISVSADVTGATVGNGNVLGLPIFLPGAGHVLKELQDAAVPTAGTIVAADTAAPLATTGDIRGTYAPNATPDGSKVFQLICGLPDIDFIGGAQFAG